MEELKFHSQQVSDLLQYITLLTVKKKKGCCGCPTCEHPHNYNFNGKNRALGVRMTLPLQHLIRCTVTPVLNYVVAVEQYAASLHRILNEQMHV